MGNGTDAAKGALGGAATGATIGSLVPGVGTAIGAGVGGLVGGLGGYFGSGGPKKKDLQVPGFEERRDELGEAIGGAAGVQVPSANAATIGGFQSGGLGGPFRSGQQQLIGQLQQQAAGQGPSLATSQFNQALDRGVAAQMSQANTGRGNRALAGRQAAQNIGGITQGLAGQAAQARMQEQLAARGQLAGVLGQARGQELGATQFDAGQFNQRALQQAGFQQDVNLANQAATLQNRAQQNVYGLGLRDLEIRNALAQQGGNQAFAAGQGPSMGSQILAGGTNALGMGFASGAFGTGGKRG